MAAVVARYETDRNQAEQRARRLDQLTDREALAGDLSQTIVHRIFEAGLDIQAALQLIRDPIAPERMQHAVDVLDDTVKCIRNLVLDQRRDTDS